MEKSQHYCYQLHLGDPVSDPVQCKNKNYPDPKNKSKLFNLTANFC